MVLKDWRRGDLGSSVSMWRRFILEFNVVSMYNTYAHEIYVYIQVLVYTARAFTRYPKKSSFLNMQREEEDRAL